MFTNKSSESFYNKGIIHYEKGEYELAIDLFKKAVEKNSSNPQFYYNLGLAYVKTEEYELAINKFKEAISLNPKDADTLQNLGIAYYKKSRFEEAVQSYKKAIEIKPNDYEIYDNLGISYFSMKMYKDSIDCFKKALNLNKNNPSLAYNLGYAYYISEQYDLAKENFLYVISLNNTDEEAYFNLGNACLKLQELNLAKENYKKTLSLNPEHEEAKKALNSLHKIETASLAEGKLEQEKPKQEVLITETPIDIDAEAEKYYLKAVNLLKEKELELAIEELNKTLSLKQNHPQARELLKTASLLLNESENLFKQGVSCYSSNDFCESINCAKKALAIKPNYVKAQDLIEKAQEKRLSIISTQKKTYKPFIENGQYAKAVDALKKAIDENPKEPENHFNLGTVYIKQKEYQYAIESLQRTLSLDPDHKEAQNILYDVIKMINNADENTKYYYKLALIYIEKEEYHKALEELKKIFDISPNNIECKTLFSKVVALMSKSKTNNHNNEFLNINLDNEIAKYQELIKSNPNDFEAYYKLGLVYSQTQNYDFAKEYFLKTIKLKSNHKEAQNSLYELIKIINA